MRNITIYVLIINFISLIIFDFYAYHKGGQEATITQILRDNSVNWPLIPVLVGIIIGHVWFSGDYVP